ncbi:hypothetical protein PHIN3_58 [Sinorhizobium phage phiN3]|uniref:Uncharacterized protein n=1 Tax=Sinorhizobium phage phiN3 TaxID=1647405 RepID=A0A0F6SIZ7_9CAUD|nr:hypothetical protein AVT40_gp058 [Sinorhizobium phage phiN3]AKF13323.1 hypothetical protein PHIN3_58 [Sinorhizobium phage phiN3]
MNGLDVRATEWYDVTNRPEWKDSRVSGYRIFVAQFGALWYQRHEWSWRHRNSIDRDPWIPSIRHFPPHMKPVDYPLERFIREMGEGEIIEVEDI